MSTYKALLKPTLIAALLVLSLDDSQASSPAGTAKTEMTTTDSGVRQTNPMLGGGDSTFKGRTKTVVHPMLKPDYPCQNLHVREPTCPSR